MSSLILRNVLCDGVRTSILVEEGRFKAFGLRDGAVADEVLDCGGLAILPAFYNTHTHAAMSVLRGYADDMDLKTWLEDHIWPYEAKLSAADIRRGSELAVREMVSTGSVFFNDMYFDIDETIDVVREAGIRASIGITVMEMHSKALAESKWAYTRNFTDPTGGRVSLNVAPHAIYTVGPEKLKASAALARECGLPLHIHVSETAGEVADCLREHGMSPVRYLDSLGVLGPNVVAAHCVHVDKEEWDILASREVTVAHCPCSNMKLGSGRFPYELAIASGANITLGTDGDSSNNNLDMREEMKFAALLAKVSGDPTILPAPEVLKWATENGAKAFGIHAGRIEAGYLADAVLVSLDGPKMTPCHNLVSNWVYAADSSSIRYTLCGGRIVYRA
ncbi:MAG: amidohydrolase [Bacteroidales bacterium]|nr:amidohydrolase [Bacteroidales bacterium]